MRLFGPSQDDIRQAVTSAIEERAATIESPTVPVSSENFLQFFGLQGMNLPRVTIDRALTVPSVLAAVTFLSRTLAAVPLHAYGRKGDSSERIKGGISKVLKFPNPEMDDFAFRQYFWQQVFTGGRGLAWIERAGIEVKNFWPLDPTKVTIRRSGMQTVYRYGGVEYPAADIIDVPFALKTDQLGHYSPITMGSKAIQLALAMNDYASTFFAGGGVPPLAVTGPLASDAAGIKRTMADISRAISAAKESDKPIFPMPPGYELKPVGFDPAKGQMTEARLFQIQETGRIYQLPPMFLQDLSSGNFANTEQQDLHLVKHNVGQWATALEGEMNLKVYGRAEENKYLEHNLDGLMRGDFKSRIEAMARGIQTAQITPNEARKLDNRPKHKNPAADELLVQGATVPLGTQPLLPAPAEPKENGEGDEPKA